ncbi:hypothetical protein HFN89_02585 [Rhizobium laguerreae]|nr:hypothetical protein [Rhizobium laguerreae]
MTHTYATLEVSIEAYDEIAQKLKDASYGHAFMEDGVIDMHGIGLLRAHPTQTPNNRFAAGKRMVSNTVRWSVYDRVLQVEVFHWSGETGETKSNAIAKALNALGHEKD